MSRYGLAWVAVVALVLGIAPRASAQGAEAPFPYVWATAYHILPETTSEESGYFSLCEGLDGRIYVGTAKYGANAYLVEFDPATRKQRIVVDAKAVTGAVGEGYAAQAKIHTRNFVGPSGVIYLGTKQGYPSPAERAANDVAIYPGGYVITYDPRNDTARSHGMPWPGQGVIDVVADESRNLMYVVTCEDQYWMIRAIDGGEDARYRWLGPQLTPYATTLIDARGRANAISGTFELVRYDPDADKLTTQPIMVDGQKLERENRHAIPTWQITPDGKTAYMVIMNQSKLYRIDLGGEATGPVNATVLGELVSGPKPDTRSSLTIAPDGRVYVLISVQNGTGLGKGRLHHLTRYDPATGECRDLGVLAVKNPDFFNFEAGPDGKKPRWSHGYHTLPDGTLTPLHAHMGLIAAHDGTLYATILYPYTLLQIPPESLPQ